MENNLRVIRINNILRSLNIIFCAVNCNLEKLEKESKKEGAQYCRIKKECNKCFLRYDINYRRFKKIIDSCKGLDINTDNINLCEDTTQIFNTYKEYFN